MKACMMMSYLCSTGFGGPHLAMADHQDVLARKPVCYLLQVRIASN